MEAWSADLSIVMHCRESMVNDSTRANDSKKVVNRRCFLIAVMVGWENSMIPILLCGSIQNKSDGR